MKTSLHYLFHQFFDMVAWIWPELHAKEKLRDLFFSDYKWVKRAQVQREISGIMWKVRDHPFTLGKFRELQQTIR